MVIFNSPGEQCVNLTIQMDMALEIDEQFHIILTSQQTSVKVLQNSAAVVIMDVQSESLMLRREPHSTCCVSHSDKCMICIIEAHCMGCFKPTTNLSNR